MITIRTEKESITLKLTEEESRENPYLDADPR